MSAPRQCGRCGMVTYCECGWPLLLACALADNAELLEACRSALSDCTNATPATERQRTNLAEKLRAAIARADPEAATTKASGK